MDILQQTAEELLVAHAILNCENWVVNHVGDDVVFEWCHWSQDCSHSLSQLHLPSSRRVPCSPEFVPKKPLWLYSNFFRQTILCWEFSRLKVSFLFLSGLLQETMAVLTKCGLLGFMCSGYHLRISFTKFHKQQIHLSLPKIWTNMTYISFFQKQFILIGRVKQSRAQVRFKHIYTKDCSWKMAKISQIFKKIKITIFLWCVPVGNQKYKRFCCFSTFRSTCSPIWVNNFLYNGHIGYTKKSFKNTGV